MPPVELDPANPWFSTVHCFLKKPKELTSTMLHWKILMRFCPSAYDFGIYGMLRKQPEISVPEIHKLVTFILKKRQEAFAKSLFLQSSGSLALLHWAGLPTLSPAAQLPQDPARWTDTNLFGNQFARRIYKELLHFKGQILKQVIPVNWWPVWCHRHPSGYRWLFFANEETRERQSCSREALWEFITLHVAFYCTGTLGDF